MSISRPPVEEILTVILKSPGVSQWIPQPIHLQVTDGASRFLVLLRNGSLLVYPF